MSDRISDISEGGTAIIPKVPENPLEPTMTEKDYTKINRTIFHGPNRTVSAKAFATALLIGDHILTNYFDDDIELFNQHLGNISDNTLATEQPIHGSGR
jgi:hypothetical protein